jgi:predicted RNA methylase
LRLRLTIQGRKIALAIPEKTVFVPNLIGLFNASKIVVRPGETVFDASTGCGIHAILCALLGAKRVVACDLNGYAIKAARRNAELNGVADRCEFVHGSFDEALKAAGRRIGLVVSTLPNTPSGHRFSKEPAMVGAPFVSRFLSGGKDGGSLSAQLVRAAAPRLARNGRIHLHVVDWNDKSLVRSALREAGLACAVVGRANIPVWGQRCNAGVTFKKRARGRPWRVRYADLPAAPGTGVSVLEAAAGARPRRPRLAGEIEIEVRR